MAVLTGQAAETAVTAGLAKQGYKILARNWKTTICEIDIIAQKAGIVYFIEVKYRRNSNQGTGFDYIRNRKLKQMEFAARVWLQQKSWEGDWRLVAAEVDKQHNVDLVEIF